MKPAILSHTLSRRRLLASAVALAAGGALAGCAAPWQTQRTGLRYVSLAAPPAPPESPPPEPTQPAPAVITYQAQSPARGLADHLELPLQLVIPKIGVEAPVIAVGLTRDGAMDVPQRAEDVGWYQYSPRPGTKGNAVLAGHLDWFGVPGVFRRLADLVVGDAVTVRAADGQERSFNVTWRQEYPVTTAPVGKVFEPTSVGALTLITCGGRWNPATRRYDTRIVVRAER